MQILHSILTAFQMMVTPITNTSNSKIPTVFYPTDKQMKDFDRYVREVIVPSKAATVSGIVKIVTPLGWRRSAGSDNLPKMVNTRYFPAPLLNSLIVFSSYDVVPNNFGFSKLEVGGPRKRMSMENYRKKAVFEREFSAAEISEWERF